MTGDPRDEPFDTTSSAQLRVGQTWRTQWVQMTSPYPVDRVARLVGGAAARGEGVGVQQGRGPVSFYLVGRVRGSRIRLTAQRPAVRNSFAPQLTGSLVPYGSGSLLTARIGPPSAVVAFMTLWLVGVAGMFLFWTVLLVRDVAGGRFRVDDLEAVALVGVMVAAGTTLLVLGRRWGRPYGVALRSWLEDRCRMSEFVQDGPAARTSGLSIGRRRTRRQRGAGPAPGH